MQRFLAYIGGALVASLVLIGSCTVSKWKLCPPGTTIVSPDTSRLERRIDRLERSGKKTAVPNASDPDIQRNRWINENLVTE